ncbi:helix-turn-helix transcriptional regulator [Clostridiaceae bacterium UIB06]|uniref:Helix-turn-helix transcriptional regulator n=1 Tax=Clostridium thailandense TaxID=2794346 RepID=A0A949TVF8_9CLOT|nr:helix-turn-helix transcriptional regulator [Clostridium thailandense]MBV7276057.1 helix-turn-helix transcriptional regulator [Clostridium thailandense]MCH5135838.1 helix-turn-helix transcriptional regulator [Clostridiaceae bacterium UIB06]
MVLNYKQFGKRIKKHRLNKKLTQEQLAELIGLSSVYISHIEVGSTKPSLETVLKICNALEITPDAILIDSVYSSKEYLQDDIALLLKNCSATDMKLIIDLIKTVLNHRNSTFNFFTI